MKKNILSMLAVIALSSSGLMQANNKSKEKAKLLLENWLNADANSLRYKTGTDFQTAFDTLTRNKLGRYNTMRVKQGLSKFTLRTFKEDLAMRRINQFVLSLAQNLYPYYGKTNFEKMLSSVVSSNFRYYNAMLKDVETGYAKGLAGLKQEIRNTLAVMAIRKDMQDDDDSDDDDY